MTRNTSKPLFSRSVSPYFLLATCLAGFVFLTVLTFFHSEPPLFDEPYFVNNVKVFEQTGLTEEFLVNMQDQAPGPLYELVHYSFSPLTGLSTPGIRLVNVFLMGLVMMLSARILMILKGFSIRESLLYSLALIAAPMVWQVAGLALTEMPTMFFSILTVFFLVLAVRLEENSLQSSLLAMAAGICLGLTILGRSPFLVMILASGLLLLNNFRNAGRWRTIILLNLFGLGISLPVFLIWNGLVPPQQAQIGSGFSLWHGLLAFAYAALLTVIVAPRWLIFNKKILVLLVIAYVVLLPLNYFLLHFEYAPLVETLSRFLPEDLLKLYPLLMSPLLATLSFYFIGCSLLRAWENRSDLVFLFLFACGMMLLASSMKVTHLFSTRYVAQAAPFFLLLFPLYDRNSAGRWIRLLVGMVIGYLSLETYMHPQ